MMATDEEQTVEAEGSEASNRRELQHAVAARGDPNSDTLAATRILRVLIIDDYSDAADTLALMVGLWGHTVKTASNALAGLDLKQAYPNGCVGGNCVGGSAQWWACAL